MIRFSLWLKTFSAIPDYERECSCQTLPDQAAQKVACPRGKRPGCCNTASILFVIQQRSSNEDYLIRGILTIQHYSGVSCHELAEGFGQLQEKLDDDQVQEIGFVAIREKFFNLAVDWLEVARRRHGKASKRVDEALQEAKEEHDRELMSRDLGEWNKTSNLVSHMREEPYDDDLRRSELFLRKRQVTEKFNQWSSQDRDLFWGLHPNSHPWAAIYVGQEPQRQKLCQGKKVGSVISRCSWLHRYDPYLLLGPFKYEEIRRNPWVGILRQIATRFELGKVMEEAREAALVPTSLVHFRGGAYTEDVAGTLRRTSKVTYRSEAVLPPLAAWTQRLELATGLSIAQHRMDSENYQIMNYGLGGAILTHRDTDNLNLDDDSFSESWSQGGPRLATIMFWLKTPAHGGRTVFTGAGGGKM